MGQLIITKQDIRIRSRREAASLAARQCERYIDEIIPVFNKLCDLEKMAKIPKYTGPTGQFRWKDLQNATSIKWQEEWLEKTKAVDISIAFSPINKLEAFAIFFVKGVADETIAFTAVGKSYCFMAAHCFPHIAFMRQEEHSGYYENLVQLYKIWAARLKKLKIADEATVIAARLEALSREVKKAAKEDSPPQRPKPIGTE